MVWLFVVIVLQIMHGSVCNPSWRETTRQQDALYETWLGSWLSFTFSTMNLSPSSFKTAAARLDISYRVLDGDSGHSVVLKDVILRPGMPFSNDCLAITASLSDHTSANELDEAALLNLNVKALKALELTHFEAKYMADLGGKRMLANGFQSWSQAREMEAEHRIPSIRSSVAYLTQYNLQG